MKKLYQWGGFALVALTPLVVIACTPTEIKQKGFKDYYTTPTTTDSATEIAFKNLDAFVGKSLVVQVKKGNQTGWSFANKSAITEGNKANLLVKFSDLEAGTAYDLRAGVLTHGSSELEDLGQTETAFTTLVAPSTGGSDQPETPTTPVDPALPLKDISVFTEIISPSNVKVNIKDAQKYIGKTLFLKYKTKLADEQLESANYFDLTARSATSATLKLDKELISSFVGKKLKVEYKKSTPSSVLTTSSSLSETPSSAWLFKIVDIPLTLAESSVDVVLDTLELGKYDVKLTALETNGTTVVKVIPESLEAFEVSAEPAPAIVPKVVTVSKEVTTANATEIGFDLRNLKLKTKYLYSVEVSGEAPAAQITNTALTDTAIPNVVVMPFDDNNSFNTSDLAKVKTSIVGKKIVLEISDLLEKYNNKIIVVSLIRTNRVDGVETVAITKKVLTENRSFKLTYENLEPSSNYQIILSETEGDNNGKIIHLEGFNSDNLKISVPAEASVTYNVTQGPASIIIEGSDALIYAGQKLVMRYAPKDVAATPALALDSEYVNEVTDTVSAEGKFTLPMLNLEKKNSDVDKNQDREYVYQIVLGDSTLYITDTEFKEAKTTKFASVKKSVNAANESTTIKYAGSSVKVTIQGLKDYTTKKLVIRAVLNPDTTAQYLADYFPTDTTALRFSEPVLVDNTTEPYEKEFKILNLDSEKYYVFQVFVEGEKNPLLFEAFDFKANVSPTSNEELITKNSVKVTVSKLGNSVGGKIQLKYASTLAEINNSSSSITQTLTAQNITVDNKDNITFAIPNITGTAIAYKLEIQPQGETDFSEAKEVVLPLPTTTAKGLVGGMTVALTNGKMLVGKTLQLKYKRTDAPSTTELTVGSATAVVGADGSATLEATNVDDGEFYTYEVWTIGENAMTILNAAAANRQVQTLSNPVAEVVYQSVKSAVTINLQNLYNLVGHSFKLQYRKATEPGVEPNNWVDWITKVTLAEDKEKEGVSFALTGLEENIKYEFQIIDETANKIIVATTSFQHKTT